ncbi:hypothetical protein KR009_009628, partial [Drosophila setifemur]
ALAVGDACQLRDNMPGICRSSADCEPLIDPYIKSGVLILSEVPSCGFTAWGEIFCCPTEPCCPDSSSSTSSTTTSTTTMRTVRPSAISRVDVPTDNTDRPSVAYCKKMRAKKRVNHLSIHIVGGYPVDPGVYPHMAALAFSTFGNFVYRCGGSLISSRFVLTAAHCLTSSPAYVRLGSVNIENPDRNNLDISVINITIHPNYVGNKYDDIALMELSQDVPDTNINIQPACLHTDPSDPPSDSKLFVAGWGVVNTTNRATSKILLRAGLEVVPLQQCNISFAEQPASVRALKQGVIETLICAADQKQQKDACRGDSGGPLINELNIEDGIYTILGVISSGFGCATITPGLYTRVASYLDFIESVVWPDNQV